MAIFQVMRHFNEQTVVNYVADVLQDVRSVLNLILADATLVDECELFGVIFNEKGMRVGLFCSLLEKLGEFFPKEYGKLVSVQKLSS
jgi:hypothetical protein